MTEPALPKLRKPKLRLKSARNISQTESAPIYEDYEYTAAEWLEEQRLRLAQSLCLAHPLWSRINEATGALDAPLAGTSYFQGSINMSKLKSTGQDTETPPASEESQSMEVTN